MLLYPLQAKEEQTCKAIPSSKSNDCIMQKDALHTSEKVLDRLVMLIMHAIGMLQTINIAMPHVTACLTCSPSISLMVMPWLMALYTISKALLLPYRLHPQPIHCQKLHNLIVDADKSNTCWMLVQHLALAFAFRTPGTRLTPTEVMQSQYRADVVAGLGCTACLTLLDFSLAHAADSSTASQKLIFPCAYL